MHYEGWGVPQNYAEALKLFELAAERPHTQALLWLGDIYAEGKGVAKDDIEAHKYYDLAATQSAHGDLELSGLHRDMANKKRNDLAAAPRQKKSNTKPNQPSKNTKGRAQLPVFSADC